MKLGILLSRFPYPLEKGDKLRAYHQIEELAKRHEIYLCTLSTKKVSEEDLNRLKPFCKEIKIIRLSYLGIIWNLFFSLFFNKLPLQVAYFYNRSAKSQVQNYFIKYQIEHLFCQLIRVTEYVKDFDYCPKTLDFMDALSQGMERRIKKAPFYLKPFVRIEAMRLKRYEHFIFKSFENKVIISEQDRELIVHANNEDISVLRNGVDLSFFQNKDLEKKYDLLFTGNMSYPPNVDGVDYLVNSILPIVWQSKPEVNLVIAGANPNQKVQKLSSKRVLVTGWVDDMRDYYSSSRVFIAPMQIGTGLQNKLLEAMAMELPCITSELANNALKAEHGKSILIGNNPEEYASHIISLLENHEAAQTLAAEGKAFVKRNYNWERSTIQLDDLFLKSEKEHERVTE